MGFRETQCKKNYKRKSNRKSFLYCFKHVEKLEDGEGKNNCPDDKDMLPFVLIDDPNTSYSSPGFERGGSARKKMSGSKRFSRALKNLLFQISHGKSHRKRKLETENAKETSRECKLNDVLSHQNCWSEDDTNHRINSSRNASSSLSSFTLLSSTVTSRSSSERNNTLELKPIECRQTFRSNWCLLLLILFALVFFGKVFAIFCTSTWLLFVPRWNAKGGVMDSDKNSDESKKKVVLEGLLKRDR